MESLPSKKRIKETYESYSGYFSEIMRNIVAVLHDKIKLMSQPTYKMRVKGFESYYRKILRVKPSEASSDVSFVYLTDMMGIRMICSFLEDINIALEQIKTIFDIKEVEIKGAEKKFSEFGYESVHVLLRIPESCRPKLEGVYSSLKPDFDEMVCEIQIRTILQDAWAEVEHELIYKTEFSPFDMPLRRKLAALNASLALADITFQEIRDYQNRLQRELDDRRSSFYAKADSFLNDKSAGDDRNIARVSPYVQGTIDDMLLQAIHAHNQGNLGEAVDIYTKILDAVPGADRNVLAVIHKHRGMAYFAMNDYEAAVADFDESIKYAPDVFRTYYYKGIVFAIQQKYEEAVSSFTKSLELNKFQAHTHFRRASAYFELHEYEKSLSDLNMALNLGIEPEECDALHDKLMSKLSMKM